MRDLVWLRVTHLDSEVPPHEQAWLPVLSKRHILRM